MPPPDFVCATPLLAQSPLADFQKANTDTELDSTRSDGSMGKFAENEGGEVENRLRIRDV